MDLVNWIEFPLIADERGRLVALESNRQIPFEIKRVYYIFATDTDSSRGFHAHRMLNQVALCIRGRCKMVLDDGFQRCEVWLDSPNKGLLIRDLIWREMHEFSDDCVLLVLASEYYDERDYIRDYALFLDEVK